MQAVGAAVDNIDDLENSMAPLLFGLGQQHVHYNGFKPDNFDYFVAAILEVLQHEMGRKLTDSMKETWRRVLKFMIGKLKDGYEDAMKTKVNPL
ncbi:hypothetical protein DPMN_049134 [Dreissena polymorpha]|uniref:Globin domain-containing protein n=1 Tax=Dreissena polymorpha TaxID=45954 RepID=A0A9D4DCS3_DREPO|nr:hypothetical protein DPMN_049134 [Dreissena polymorpha]